MTTTPKLKTETTQKVRELLEKLEKACHRKTSSLKKKENRKNYSEKSEVVREAIIKIGRCEKDLISLMEEVLKEQIRPIDGDGTREKFKKFSVIVPLKKLKNVNGATVGNPIIYLDDSSYGYDHQKKDSVSIGTWINEDDWRIATKEEISEVFLAILRSKQKSDKLIELLPKKVFIELMMK
jgi:hypothetical protein